MNEAPVLALLWSDWLDLLMRYLSVSLLAVGGAVTTLPELHRFLVDQRQWLSEAQFSAAVAIAQSAPGPNALFVALLGWNLGVNAGSMVAALGGAVLSLVGFLLPSSLLTFFSTRWVQRNREWRAVRAFKLGMSPVVIALLTASGWIVGSAHGDPVRDWPLWLLTALATLLAWRTRLHILWLLAAGATLGALGLV